MKYTVSENGVVCLPHLFPSSFQFLSLIKKGDRLELRPEPNNRVDGYAIQVYWSDMPIGYVSNTGATCSYCLMMRKGEKACSNCGSYSKVRGGLAYRLHKRGWLNNYICQVTKVLPDNMKAPVYFTVISTFDSNFKNE